MNQDAAWLQIDIGEKGIQSTFRDCPKKSSLVDEIIHEMDDDAARAKENEAH